MPTDTVVTQAVNLASGLWKFSSEVKLNDLVALATEWKNGPEGQRYGRLYVRGVSQDGLGIGFEYEFEGKNHKRYFYKTAHELTEKFGDNFVGYDISSPTYFVKR